MIFKFFHQSLTLISGVTTGFDPGLKV